MSANVLKQIEAGDIIFFPTNQYSGTNHKRYTDVFQKMVGDGHLSGDFADDKWMGFSGIKSFGIEFTLDRDIYMEHGYKVLRIDYRKIQDMLRCYAVYICGTYIFATINSKLSHIRAFLAGYGTASFELPATAQEDIQDFLCFIGCPDDLISDIIQRIQFGKAEKTHARELSHLINYLAISNEVHDMFQSPMTDEEFKKWFPVLFWSDITFVIPLRATEMLVTPFDCINRKDGRIFIRLRRTSLKNGKRTVYYEVDNDYKVFEYEVPDTWIVQMIDKYKDITKTHERKYLFDHTKYMINDMVSLQSFNMLLASFVQERLVGNPKYDYSKYATGINEFDLVTAGDSRPIAMSNLFFQDISADICRQLADHNHISTSYGYYTNVSNTIQCASIMQIQRMINHGKYQAKHFAESYPVGLLQREYDPVIGSCMSPLQPKETGRIDDCIRENHIHECMGCRYYIPTDDELRTCLEQRKARLDDISRQVVECINGDKTNIDFDELFLNAQTNAARFKIISDENAEKEAVKWQRHRNIPKTSF